PARLEAVGQDAGNRRGIADESESWPVRMQDMPIKIETVRPDLEPIANWFRQKGIVCLPAGGEDDEVSRNLVARIKNDFRRCETANARSSGLDGTSPDQSIEVGARQHGRFAETADLDRLVRHQAFPRAKLRPQPALESQQKFNQAPPEPDQRPG